LQLFFGWLQLTSFSITFTVQQLLIHSPKNIAVRLIN